MGVYTHTSGNWLTRRGAFLLLLIAFHIAFFVALKTGFAVKLVKEVLAPIQAEIINEEVPEEPPPPPPEVVMELPPVQVPPVLVDIQLPPPPPTAIQTQTTVEPAPAPPAPPTVTRTVVVTKATLTFKPDTADYYPSASKNLGEEGRVRIRLCIGADGRVKQATVAEPSKYPRLDEAGVKLTRQYRFKPGTEDGKVKESDCFIQPVSFSLKEE